MRIFFVGLLLFQLLSVKAQDETPDTLYYSDGSVKAFGSLVGGHKVGEWKHFYPDGTLNAIMTYDTVGQLDGDQRFYDFQGNLIARERWINDGLEDTSYYYHPNGKLEKVGVYKHSLYEGVWHFFYDNGDKKRVGHYREGLPVGEWKFYYENGILQQSGYFSNGKENGLWHFYNEKGRKTYEGHYEYGERVGQWYFFKKSGKRKKWKKFK